MKDLNKSGEHGSSGAGDIAGSLRQEAVMLMKDHKPSVQFEDLWSRHTSRTQRTAALQRPFAPFFRWSVGLGVILLTSVIVMCAGIISPQVAEALRNIPFLQYLYDKGVDTADLQRIDEHNLTDNVRLAAQDQGIVFEMVNVYYDGIQLVMNYEVEYPESLPAITEEQAAVYYKLSFKDIEPTSISTHDFTITGEHTFVGTTRLNFGNESMPEKLMLTMAVDCIGTTRGDWDITLPLDRYKSEMLTKTLYPQGIGFTYAKEEYNVQKLILGPVTTQLVIQKSNPYYNFNAQLEDDMGTIYSDQGGDGATLDYYYFNFSPLSEMNPKPEYMTITLTEPVENEQIKQTEERKRLGGVYPLVLQGNHGGTVTVTNVEFKENRTVVTYEASQPESQNTWLTLEDKEGGMIFPKGQPVRISRDSLTFQLNFSGIEPDETIHIVAQSYSYSDSVQRFKLRIPLKWDE